MFKLLIPLDVCMMVMFFMFCAVRPLQDGVRFISIGAMYSELVAVSAKGELYQWKWNEPEPYRNAQVSTAVFISRMRAP